MSPWLGAPTLVPPPTGSELAELRSGETRGPKKYYYWYYYGY